MERKFYTNDFEQLLKENADQFKMSPSKKVWHGIYNDIHPGRRWPSIAMSLIFVFTLILVGHLNTQQSQHKNTYVSDVPENGKDVKNITDRTNTGSIKRANKEPIGNVASNNEKVPSSIPVNEVISLTKTPVLTMNQDIQSPVNDVNPVKAGDNTNVSSGANSGETIAQNDEKPATEKVINSANASQNNVPVKIGSNAVATGSMNNKNGNKEVAVNNNLLSTIPASKNKNSFVTGINNVDNSETSGGLMNIGMNNLISPDFMVHRSSVISDEPEKKQPL